jgi:PTS system ascorbate-specific IIA component
MSVGLLLVTHDQIGEVLLRTATRMLGEMPLAVKVLAVSSEADPDELLERARLLADRLDDGNGVLVFTDMYGSTPSNIAAGLADPGRVNVISGLSLPMLIRTLNYASLDLEGLTHKAISGGVEGIFRCTQPEHS